MESLLWDEKIELSEQELLQNREGYEERMKKERREMLVKQRRFETANLVQSMIQGECSRCMAGRLMLKPYCKQGLSLVVSGSGSCCLLNLFLGRNEQSRDITVIVSTPNLCDFLEQARYPFIDLGLSWNFLEQQLDQNG